MSQPGGKDSEKNEIYMDAGDMYREETFTDNAVGTLRRLTPVTANGDVDLSRTAQYIGTTQIMTNAGPLPLSFQIPANSMSLSRRSAVRSAISNRCHFLKPCVS